jgi:hypothetical protein
MLVGTALTHNRDAVNNSLSLFVADLSPQRWGELEYGDNGTTWPNVCTGIAERAR